MKADGNGTDVESEAFRKLFIGGLTSTTTDEILRAFYEQYGELTDCIVMKDPASQRSRGFGFVTYAKKTQVDAAQAARPHEIDGKKVDSKRAVPKDANDKGPSQVSTQRLYVSGIKDRHTEDMLKDYFSEFGNVLKVDIAKDKNSDTIRGFAFVHFDDYDAVDRCVLMKSHQINDQRCDVTKGLSKEEMAKVSGFGTHRNERHKSPADEDYVHSAKHETEIGAGDSAPRHGGRNSNESRPQRQQHHRQQERREEKMMTPPATPTAKSNEE